MNQEFFNECFTYLPKSGHLKWKKRPVHHFKTALESKTVNGRMSGEIVTGKRVVISGEGYSTAAIVWVLHNGGNYPNMVYHLNGNAFDNRIENLTIKKQFTNKPFVKKSPPVVQSDNVLGNVLLSLKRVLDSNGLVYRKSWMYNGYQHLLPYCIKQQSNGKFIVLDRYYKPFGFDYDLERKPFIDYDDNPDFDSYCVAPSQLDLNGTEVKRGFVHFYDDSTAPRQSAHNVNAYLELVARIFKLSAIL